VASLFRPSLNTLSRLASTYRAKILVRIGSAHKYCVNAALCQHSNAAKYNFQTKIAQILTAQQA
ncbi:hypothetical protein ACVBEH_08035, partial [Roseateles sp. GG27B]